MRKSFLHSIQAPPANFSRRQSSLPGRTAALPFLLLLVLAAQVLGAQNPNPNPKVAAASPEPENPESEYGSLALTVPRDEVYLGEVFPLELELKVRYSGEVSMPKLNSDGITLGKSSAPSQTKIREGNNVLTRVLFRYSATAVRSGPMTLGPASIQLQLQIPRQVRIQNRVVTQVTRRQVTLRSRTKNLTVLEPPAEKRPASFNGAVGRFGSFQVTASPTNLAAGDPITITLRIAGEGDFERIDIPLDTGWQEFTVYPPSENITTSGGSRMNGQKVIEQVVAPRNSEIRELPAFEFSYFDPIAREYRIHRQPPIPIRVEPNPEGAAQPTIIVNAAGLAGSQAQPEDILHIKPHLGAIAGPEGPLLTRPVFWICQSLPLLLWLGFLGRNRYRKYLADHPRLARRRRVDKLVRRERRMLRHHAAAQDSPAFFETAFRAVQARLGERLDLSPAGLTEEKLSEVLHHHPSGDRLIPEVRRVFDKAGKVRYAAVQSSFDLADEFREVEALLARLRQMPPRL